jgi:hypothetical protein
MNSGERDELLIKLTLVEMRDKGIKWKGSYIETVGFGRFEYSSMPKEMQCDFCQLSDIQLIGLADRLGIGKAGIFDKSDVYINGIGFSLKSLSAAPPALVNHTPRPGFETACWYSGTDITELDELVDEYWYLRNKGIISEDIRNTDPNSPFRKAKHILKPILEYFLFTGTGRGPSNHPAEFILEYQHPQNPDTWEVLEPSTAVDEVWEKLIFSMRAKKGMPAGYDPHTYKGPKAQSIARWTKYHSGDYRGALHIRVHS